MRCWFQVSMPYPGGCWRPISPFSQQVKNMCRRKDGPKCTTNLLQAINHKLGQFSVTLSRSFSTFIIHEERLEYGFLRAKRPLFFTVLSVPSTPSRCSPCISPSPLSSSVISTNTEGLCVQLPSKDWVKKINKTCWPFALHWLTNRLNCPQCPSFQEEKAKERGLAPLSFVTQVSHGCPSLGHQADSL